MHSWKSTEYNFNCSTIVHCKIIVVGMIGSILVLILVWNDYVGEVVVY